MKMAVMMAVISWTADFRGDCTVSAFSVQRWKGGKAPEVQPTPSPSPSSAHHPSTTPSPQPSSARSSPSPSSSSTPHPAPSGPTVPTMNLSPSSPQIPQNDIEYGAIAVALIFLLSCVGCFFWYTCNSQRRYANWAGEEVPQYIAL